MDTKDDNEKKLDYIYGELSKEEEARFEEELKQHPDEAIDIELQKRIFEQAKFDKQLEEIRNDPELEWVEKETEKAVKEYKELELDYICGNLSKEEEARFEKDIERAHRKPEAIERKKKYLEKLKHIIQLASGQKPPGYKWSIEEAEKAIWEYEEKNQGE